MTLANLFWGAVTGAAAGGVVSAAQGKDVGKGMVYGAGTGGVGAAAIGSTPKKPKIPKPVVPSPVPTPMMLREVGEAERQTRRRGRGRPATILAGRLMSQYGKRLLGE